MPLFRVIILAIVQGLAELLPVSSSAHVIVAEKLMGMAPSAPEMTLLLVMLHTGTMFAVIVYFWRRWQKAFFSSAKAFKSAAISLILATVLTVAIGGALTEGIEKVMFKDQPKAWVEQLFDRLDLIAPALAAAGVLILIAGFFEKQAASASSDSPATTSQSCWIGAVQGLCLPFRGFSRSGATISTGMLAGVPRSVAEDFSFALAVLITPAAIGRELLRLVQTVHGGASGALHSAIAPSLLGTLFAFLAGLVALKWLSRWLETGKWYLFGIYCLLAAGVVEYLFRAGY
jgi:undecaprenyl-diphosphatase